MLIDMYEKRLLTETAPSDNMTKRTFADIQAEIDVVKNKSARLWMLQEELQSVCKHINVEYWRDPSGNNGGGWGCNDCGADL